MDPPILGMAGPGNDLAWNWKAFGSFSRQSRLKYPQFLVGTATGGADNLERIFLTLITLDYPQMNPKLLFFFSRFDRFRSNTWCLSCYILFIHVYPWVQIHGPQAVQSRQRAPLPASPAETLGMEASLPRPGAVASDQDFHKWDTPKWNQMDGL